MGFYKDDDRSVKHFRPIRAAIETIFIAFLVARISFSDGMDVIGDMELIYLSQLF
jgi:Rad3-related DNA helicase